MTGFPNGGGGVALSVRNGCPCWGSPQETKRGGAFNNIAIRRWIMERRRTLNPPLLPPRRSPFSNPPPLADRLFWASTSNLRITYNSSHPSPSHWPGGGEPACRYLMIYSSMILRYSTRKIQGSVFQYDSVLIQPWEPMTPSTETKKIVEAQSQRYRIERKTHNGILNTVAVGNEETLNIHEPSRVSALVKWNDA